MILVMSSQVAYGHVGLSAMVPVLSALGTEVIALPTVILSNHPGHRTCSKHVTDIAVLETMVSALEKNGFLDRITDVVTGYFPSAEHVAFANDLFERVRARTAQSECGPAALICDPVMGDDTGLYISEATARAIVEQLVPQAEVTTPNAFELGWMTGRQITDRDSAVAASIALPGCHTIVTSVPARNRSLLGNLMVYGKPGSASSRRDNRGDTWTGPPETYAYVETRRYEHVPKGTGDTFTALWLGFGRLHGHRADPFALASAAIDKITASSRGEQELNLCANLPALSQTVPLELTTGHVELDPATPAQ